MRSNSSKILVLPMAILIGAVLVSLCSGRYPLSPGDILQILAGKSSAVEAGVFWELRLPRTILAALSGMALSVSGTALQKLFLNPLASPDIIGVTSGCSAGAAAGIVLFGGSMLSVQLFSFMGGLAAMIFAMTLAGMMRSNKMMGFVLAGIAASALSTALIMTLKYLADPVYQLSSVDFWLMGGFYTASFKQVLFVLPVTLIGTGMLILLSWQLQVISYGQEQAAALGVPVRFLRLAVLFITTVMTAVVVSASGLISWIGLISPHIAKLYGRQYTRHHILLSGITGAALLLAADTIAKTVMTNELPVSIITTLLGVPILLYLTANLKKP